ncbi:MAG: 2Fe-2S iron-sulfur cluster binding domain-containing protein [Clostridia bacterium]|nr:2Fe-2S iron-sulfur cluster binding domain-containing protein [Clostridia bacterium]
MEQKNTLSKSAMVRMVKDRVMAVRNASAAPVKDLYTYPANKLAQQMHPHVQCLKIKEIITHSDDFKSFIFAPDTAKGTARIAWFSAGQYLVIAVTIDGKTYNRPYSIASAPRATLRGEIEIAVKRVDGGIVSAYVLDNWKVGDSVPASGPLGDFTYEPLRDAKHIIGIAGGSGITPFRSLAKAICDGDEDCSLTLLYGSRTLADAVFNDEFKQMAKENEKIKLVNVLSDEKKRGCESGFIDAKLITKYAPKDEAYSIFLCGPQAMYDFADKEIAKLNIKRKYVRHELFGEYFHPEKNADYSGDIKATYKLTVRIAGKERTIDCAADTSLLRAMEAAGINAPSDCRSGRCGWCHSQLISGEVYIPESVDGRRAADKEFGYIHPCCSFPLSDIVLDVPPLPY